MKLEIELNERVIEAEFNLSNGSAKLEFDGEIHDASVSEPEPGLFVIILNNRVYRCAEGGDEGEIVVNGRRIRASVRDKRNLRGAAAGGAGGGRATLLAPMPGKVVQVLVKAGDEVAANQGVLVVEAMKMQNEVQSPRAGKVAEIRATEGQTVNAGEVLAVIE